MSSISNKTIEYSEQRRLRFICQYPYVRAELNSFLLKSPFSYTSGLAEKFYLKFELLISSEQNFTDEEIFRQLREYMQGEVAQVNSAKDVLSTGFKNRRNLRVETVKDLAGANFTPRRILDFGCHTGAILEGLGATYSLTPENLIGVDINPPPADHHFNFIDSEEFLSSDTQKAGSIDLITAMVSLHHVPDTALVIKKFYELLSPQGVLILREHDNQSLEREVFFDLMHMFWSKVYDPTQQMLHERTYLSFAEWDKLFKTYKFHVDPSSEKLDSLTEFFTGYRIYRK